MIRKFTIDKWEASISPGFRYLGTKLPEIILENNIEYLVKQTIFGDIIFECENKPRDLPIFGIKWIEIIDE